MMNEENEFEEVSEIEIEEKPLYEHFKIIVEKGQFLLRIDKYLMTRIENATRSKVKASIVSGNLVVNGNHVKSNYRVKPYDEISLLLAYPPRDKEVTAENIPLNIVYEDNEVILINKPAGMVVHPGFGNYSGTMVNGLMYHFRNLPYFQENNPRPGLVHRIDKNTSGLLVVVKDELSLSKMAKQFFEKTAQRTYQALVWGDVEKDQGTVTGFIGRNIKNRMQMAVYDTDEFGKHAVTHYRVLERFRYVTLIECKLETGRTHQIRVHMRHIGHTIFNDSLYFGNFVMKGTTYAKYKQFVQNCFDLLPGQALHAKTLGFKHPKTGEDMSFDSELPENFKLLIEKWRNYYNTYTNEDNSDIDIETKESKEKNV
jgi:23S rRNA pseudouridine1911/1915/1917 synthase